MLEAARKGDLAEARRLWEGVAAPGGDVFATGLDRALGRVKGQPRAAMGCGFPRYHPDLARGDFAKMQMR